MANVLIIDDDKTVCSFVERLLAADGHSVRLASTGAEGLTEAQQVSPDLVLLDIMLPDITGFEVARRFDASDALRDIPIVYMTGLLHGIEAALLGGRLRGRPVLAKPVRAVRLIECVATQLGRAVP